MSNCTVIDGTANAIVTGIHREIIESGVYEEVNKLVLLILDRTPSVADAEHARHVIEIFVAAYRSAETGMVQEFTTTF